LTAQILKNPDELLYDVLTGRYVALNWTHNTAIIYEKTKRNITVVTIIYSSELMDIVNKRKEVAKAILEKIR
jgi:hypothetical protein